MSPAERTASPSLSKITAAAAPPSLLGASRFGTPGRHAAGSRARRHTGNICTRDRIGHGRSIEFAPANRGSPTPTPRESRSRIPAGVHFRSARPEDEKDARTHIRQRRVSRRAGGARDSEKPRMHARCQVDMPLSRLGPPRRCIVGSRCQVRN